MTRWRIQFKTSARKALGRLDPPVQRRVIQALELLSSELTLYGSAKLSDIKALKGLDGYRLRVGDFRILFTLEEQVLTILVFQLGPRGSVYRSR